MQSLMAGTPAVSTSIGIEGFDIRHNEHVLVADSPEAFADSIVRLAGDEALWNRIAKRGREWASEAHSHKAVYDRFTSALEHIAGKRQ
jgi:glycosyltransferase involved in cell wall biosynthesis